MEENKPAEEVVQNLLKLLEIEAAVTVQLDEDGALRVQLETSETGLLIGYHGRTLESLQIVLGLLISRVLGKWQPVYLNIGDYREKREEAIMLMAQRAAERALSLGRPVELARLTAAERRIVHLTLSTDNRVETESVGEGRQRVLLIKPKAN